MTIVIGIKCRDGVVISCDSQSEYERGVDVKRLTQNKIYEFDNRYLFAGSGLMSHIQILVDTVSSALRTQSEQQRSILNKDEGESTVEQALLALVKHYNVDRSTLLGVDNRDFFSPLVIFASIDPDSSYYLDLLHGNYGMVEPMADYVAIGSGAAYAELLFRSLFYSNMGVEQAIAIAAYIIDEVKAIDPHCGGNTQISTITTQGETDEERRPVLTSLSSDTITANYLNPAKPSLDLIRTHLIPRILRGELNEDRIREIAENA